MNKIKVGSVAFTLIAIVLAALNGMLYGFTYELPTLEFFLDRFMHLFIGMGMALYFAKKWIQADQ